MYSFRRYHENNNDPDVVDPDEFDVLNVWEPERDISEEEMEDPKEREVIDNIFRSKKDIPEDALTSDNLESGKVDIGTVTKVQAKVIDNKYFDSNHYVSILKPNKRSVLSVRNKRLFDDFTNKYGILRGNMVFIDWERVAKDYKGVYIASSSLENRDDMIPFGEKNVENWVNNEYNFLDDVLIFIPFRALIEPRTVDKPFKGYIVDQYSLNENDFARFNDKITFDKILLIDDLRAFDKFTNKYGYVENGKIDIDWNDVNIDYEGIYIDPNSDLSSRENKAPHMEQFYDSWFDDVGYGIVYVFP